MNLTLVFIRHGKSASNLEEVMSGHFDTPLTDQGRQELRELRLKHDYPVTDMYFSSDLSRAKETFEILYGPTPLNKTLPLFRETFFGHFEQQPIASSLEPFYKAFFEDDSDLEAENYVRLKARVLKGLHEVIDLLVDHQKTSATIVCHNGIIRMIHHLMLETSKERYRDISIPNGCGIIVKLEVNQNREILSKRCTFFGL